jgi:hypothetical protein
MKEMLTLRETVDLFAAPQNDKLALFSKHCQRKWIEDSIDPYSLNTLIESQKSFHKVFPIYNLDRLTKKTKETEQNSALMTSYVKVRMLNAISLSLISASLA